MAGGSGERFWPLSQPDRPKQLLKLAHPGMTLLEEAAARVAPLVGAENVFVATTRALAEPIATSGTIPAANVIAEPTRRNTLGCLIWASATLAARFDSEDLSLAVVTADHSIGDEEAFRATVGEAMGLAEETGALVTIGIRPTRAETGYGYLEIGEPMSPGRAARQARAFREKPSPADAARYVAGGRHLWNSGMFFWTLASFQRELSAAQPESFAVLGAIRGALTRGDENGAERLFGQLPTISVDKGLMELARHVAVVPAEFVWDDVGAWDALQRCLPTDAEGNVVQGAVVQIDAKGCVLINEGLGAPVGVVGIENLVVVASRHGVLVCPKDQAQRVREIVARLERERA